MPASWIGVLVGPSMRTAQAWETGACAAAEANTPAALQMIASGSKLKGQEAVLMMFPIFLASVSPQTTLPIFVALQETGGQGLKRHAPFSLVLNLRQEYF